MIPQADIERYANQLRRDAETADDGVAVGLLRAADGLSDLLAQQPERPEYLKTWHESKVSAVTDLTPVDRAPATRDTCPHDSDAWETVSGWVWVCRTCLDKGVALSEAHAREMLARHDAGPIPWWVERVRQSQQRTA